MQQFDHGAIYRARAVPPLVPGQRLLLEILAVVDCPDGSQELHVRLEALTVPALPGVPLAGATPMLAAQPARELVSATFGLELDRVQQLVFLQGQLVVLGHQEYQLLVFLVDHAHHLLSHRQILVAVWQEGYEQDFAVLYSSLYRLKQALAPFGSRMIQSQRGSGYRFVPEPRST